MLGRALKYLVLLAGLGLSAPAGASLIPVELSPALLPQPGPSPELELEQAAAGRRMLHRLAMTGGTAWLRHAGFDPLDYHLLRLLETESWSQWQAFRRSPSTVIPLGPAGRILLLVRAGFTAKAPLRALYTRQQLAAGTRTFKWVSPPDGRSPEGLLRFLAYAPAGRNLGLLDLDSSEVAKQFNLASWLMEGEGVFSARPWSWDNFLPRLFSVAGLLALGLVLVESLRGILRLGSRTLGQARRREEEEARAFR